MKQLYQQIVSWCFELSQLQRVTSGLKDTSIHLLAFLHKSHRNSSKFELKHVKQNTHILCKHQTQFFEEMVHQRSSLSKKHKTLDMLVCWTLSGVSIPDQKNVIKNILKWTETKRFVLKIIVYKRIVENISAMRQHAAHTTDRLSPPSCHTRAIHISLPVDEKYSGNIWKRSREWACRLKKKIKKEKERDRKSNKSMKKEKCGRYAV